MLEEGTGINRKNINIANKFIAGIAGVAIAILIGIWLAFFQQDVLSINTFFPDGSCDGASNCVNALGGFGALQYDQFSLVRWFFIFITLNIGSLLAAGLVGGTDKLANGVAIVVSVVGAMLNIALLAFLLIAWVPHFNKIDAGYRNNPFNDPRYCCVAAFYSDPNNFCPNGQPNYPAGMEVPCVAPLTTLAASQLAINASMVYLLIAIIIIILLDVAIAIAAYFSIQDPSSIFGVLQQFVGDMMDVPHTKRRYNIMKIKNSDDEGGDSDDYEDYTNNRYTVNYAGK